MTTLVRLDGEIVATVGATRIHLAPAIQALPDGDPKLRLVVLMAAYALEVAHGTVAGPYSDGAAKRYGCDALNGLTQGSLPRSTPSSPASASSSVTRHERGRRSVTD